MFQLSCVLIKMIKWLAEVQKLRPYSEIRTHDLLISGGSYIYSGYPVQIHLAGYAKYKNWQTSPKVMGLTPSPIDPAITVFSENFSLDFCNKRYPGTAVISDTVPWTISLILIRPRWSLLIISPRWVKWVTSVKLINPILAGSDISANNYPFVLMTNRK